VILPLRWRSDSHAEAEQRLAGMSVSTRRLKIVLGRAIRGGPRGPRCRDGDRHSGPDFRKRPSAKHRHAFRPSSACGGGAEVFGTHRLRPTLTQSGHQAQAVSHSPSRSASVAPDSPTEPIAFMRLRARCGSALRRRRPLLPPTQRASSSQLAHRR
jgi:hypothetical protein